MIGLNGVLSGAVGMASLVVAVFFVRFWRSTADRFFLFFALSFLLQAVSRLFVEPRSIGAADLPITYLLRLVAYALILVAVIDKNRRHGADVSPDTVKSDRDTGQ